MKLSPWFDAKTQPPARGGEYQFRGWLFPLARVKWDGKDFRHVRSDAVVYLTSGDQWRGVLKEK